MTKFIVERIYYFYSYDDANLNIGNLGFSNAVLSISISISRQIDRLIVYQTDKQMQLNLDLIFLQSTG